MPIYEYRCVDCGQRFEAMRSIKEADAPIPCQNCHSQHTNRMISVFFAQSGGRVIASGNSGCASCRSSACATCGQN